MCPNLSIQDAAHMGLADAKLSCDCALGLSFALSDFKNFGVRECRHSVALSARNAHVNNSGAGLDY